MGSCEGPGVIWEAELPAGLVNSTILADQSHKFDKYRLLRTHRKIIIALVGNANDCKNSGKQARTLFRRNERSEWKIIMDKTNFKNIYFYLQIAVIVLIFFRNFYGFQIHLEGRRKPALLSLRPFVWHPHFEISRVVCRRPSDAHPCNSAPTSRSHRVQPTDPPPSVDRGLIPIRPQWV